MKNALPWILVLALTAGLAAVLVSGRTKDAELAKLRQENQDTQALHAQLDEAKTEAKTLLDEVTGLRVEKQELLRLRNEINKLRTDNQQLEKKVSAAQTEVQRAQQQASQAQQSGSQLQNENQQLRSAASQSTALLQRTACISNLRQFERAKQQWAADHNKGADALATSQDLAPYLQNAGPSMVCPSGGGYTLNPVGQPATCTIVGHAIQ